MTFSEFVLHWPAASRAPAFSVASAPAALTAEMLLITSARNPVMWVEDCASTTFSRSIERPENTTNPPKTSVITSRNTEYHGRMKAVITTAATTVVRTGITCQTTVSQNISKAPVNLLVWETNEPENRSEWNPRLWRVRWSKTRWNSRFIAMTSKDQAAYSAIRQPTTWPSSCESP